MISDLIDAYWRRAIAATAVPATSLGVFRWIFGLFQLVLYVPHAAFLDDVPSGLFDPPEFGIANLVGGFPPAPFFTVIDIVAVIALLAMTVGWRTRTATLVVVVCRLISMSFVYSFGKIDHTDIMLTWLLLVLAFSRWDQHYTLAGILRGERNNPTPMSAGESDRGDPEASVPLAVFATVLAFGLFTAGFVKLRGWVDFDLSTSGVLRWYYPSRDMLGRDQFLAGSVPGTPAIILELSEYLAVVIELTGFVFLLLGRRTWLAYLALLTTFHLANLFILNIPFPGQVFTYLVFVRICAPRLADTRQWIVAATTIAGLAAVWNIGRRFFGDGAITVLPGGQPDQWASLLYISMLVSIGVLAALLHELQGLIRHGRGTPQDAPID